MTVRGSALAVQRNDLESQRLDPHAAALIVIVPAGRTRCRPRLAGLLRVPPRHDEVAGLPHCGAQELEALEALRLVDSLRTIGEAALDLLLSTLREGQRSDRGGPIRKLGLVGGTGPESTISYYRTLTQGVQRAVGVGQLPPLVIDSLSVFEVLDLCARDDMDGLLRLPQRLDRPTCRSRCRDRHSHRAHAAHRLRSAARRFSDSAHQRRRGHPRRGPGPERLRRRTARHGADHDGRLLRAAAPGRGHRHRDPRRQGDRLHPGQDRAPAGARHRHGFDAGRFRVGHRAPAHRPRRRPVVLGCTELPLLLDDTSSPVPCLDPVEIHSRALIAAIVDQ